MGVFNSKLTNFWFDYYYESTKVRGGYFDLNGNQIKSIPIPEASKDIQDRIAELVDKVIESKVNDYTLYVKEEAEIDRLVYDLYGLTEDEIAIVEGASR